MMTPNISMTETGNGSSILIMHGLLGAGRNWGNVVRDLSRDYKTYVLDLPNHGGSDWIDQMDYRNQAAIIADWIEGHGAPMTVLGHSMGGKIAMTLALTRPELVQNLIVADTAPVTYDHDFGVYTRAMQGVPLAQMTKRAEIDSHLAAEIIDPRIRFFLMQNLESTPDGFRWRSNLEVIQHSMPDILGFPDFADHVHFAGRTLFISGALSDYVLPEYHAIIKSRFPQVQFIQLAEAGHWLHADQPAAFIAGVRAFLQGD